MLLERRPAVFGLVHHHGDTPCSNARARRLRVRLRPTGGSRLVAAGSCRAVHVAASALGGNHVTDKPDLTGGCARIDRARR